KVYNNNKAFLIDYKAYLLGDEVKYNLMLGISNKDNDSFTFISSVVDDRFLLGILAGKNLILASNTMDDDVYDEMIEYMNHVDYPGIIGTREHCEKYNELYTMKYGVSLVVKMNQRIYRCDKVKNYSEELGIVRLATEKDIEVLKYWALDFYSGIEPNTTLLQSEESVIEKIKRSVLFVLVVNDVVVSMTVRTRAINKTETVSFVYTPLEYRRKGYASRIVEEVTRYILNDGRIATLYTDLDNPISNSIYMKIGYLPHCDSVMLNKY
ncbi:MAG: GNAT family N-acetyltransferase, partial [Firmicutes bacterium]|nr:GNAT family N-acetyltransferase [Bacillota bacterium]